MDEQEAIQIAGDIRTLVIVKRRLGHAAEISETVMSSGLYHAVDLVETMITDAEDALLAFFEKDKG